MPAPAELEQILWTEWLDHYWIETISMLDPKVFVKACRHKHSDNGTVHTPSAKASSLTTCYFAGDDGYVYYNYRDPVTGEIITEPIYKVAKALGDQGPGV